MIDKRQPGAAALHFQFRVCGAALLVALITTLGGCGKSGDASKPKTPARQSVFVTLLPQKQFVEKVAGGRFDVQVLIGQGSSEHQYDPSPQQVVALGKAAAYFRIGVISEDKILQQLSAAYPKLPIIDTRGQIKLRAVTPDEGHACDEHDGHDHSDHSHGEYGGKDPHIWLDPLLVKEQAHTIARGLALIDPAHTAEYEANAVQFERDLVALHARIEAKLAPYRGREFFVYHPTYGYFADRYGLKQVAVEVDGKEPTPKELDKLIQRAKAARMRTVFYQPQFADHAAKAVAEAIGGKAVVLDPLAPDFIKNLEEIAIKLAEAFQMGAERETAPGWTKPTSQTKSPTERSPGEKP